MPKTAKKPSSDRSSGVAAWIARSDRGPHTATLPFGQQVTFVVPDTNQLILGGRLPDDLAEFASIAAAYPNGADGYMYDVAFEAERTGDRSRVTAEVRKAIELGYWLISEMLVEPAVTPDEARQLPEADTDMLLAFAERRANTDAKGVKLPIKLLEELAPFRGQPGHAPADDAGGGEDPGVPAADGGADGGPV